MTGSDYAAYIWSAYGFTALAVITLLIRVVADHRAQAAALARLSHDMPEAAAQRD